jgi:hypothetical protein
MAPLRLPSCELRAKAKAKGMWTAWPSMQEEWGFGGKLKAAIYFTASNLQAAARCGGLGAQAHEQLRANRWSVVRWRSSMRMHAALSILHPRSPIVSSADRSIKVKAAALKGQHPPSL